MDDYLVFNGQQFNELFNTVNLDNLAPIDKLPAITGDFKTDSRIREIATRRGYLPRPQVLDESKLISIEGSRYCLQPQAAQSYLNLMKAAADNGLIIILSSAYRDYDRQRTLFLDKVPPPYKDEDVFEHLKTVAIPGYSKHHSGYAIDIAEKGQDCLRAFVKTKSYQWLSANNYQNAKAYGWIPSYPPGGYQQGPDPEPWEFTYVGIKYLKKLKPD